MLFRLEAIRRAHSDDPVEQHSIELARGASWAAGHALSQWDEDMLQALANHRITLDEAIRRTKERDL